MIHFCVKGPHIPRIKNINRRLSYFYACRADLRRAYTPLHAALVHYAAGVASFIGYSESVVLGRLLRIRYACNVASP